MLNVTLVWITKAFGGVGPNKKSIKRSTAALMNLILMNLTLS